jgi:hypothetical protein
MTTDIPCDKQIVDNLTEPFGSDVLREGLGYPRRHCGVLGLSQHLRAQYRPCPGPADRFHVHVLIDIAGKSENRVSTAKASASIKTIEEI